MSEAHGSVDPGVRPGWRWDVALSFDGAQRDYVEQVARELQARGVRCFYDVDEQIELWGRYLAEELPDIYGSQAAAVVVFVSAEYVARYRIRLERQSALAQAVQERREYFLPARFDDTPLPELLSGIVAVDLRALSPQQFAAVVADKLAALGIVAPSPSAGDGDPVRAARSMPPAEATRATGAEADAAASVYSNALDVLSDALGWQLSPSRWQAIDEVLVAMDTALQANDPQALYLATDDLELAAPLRITRIGDRPVSPQNVVRRRIVQLMRSLSKELAQLESGNGGAGR